MRVADFDFELPAELIAQAPPPERGASRLMVVHRADSRFETSTVACLPDLLAPGDVLVVNDTKVFPARLLGHRVPSGGVVECLLLGRLDEERWDALVHPGQKLKPGARLAFTRGDASLHGEIVGRGSYGRRTVRLWSDRPTHGRPGHRRHRPRAAAPLHQAPGRADRPRPLPDGVRQRRAGRSPRRRQGSTSPRGCSPHSIAAGVERVAITLHVGYGTFKPVRVDEVEAHRVDAERFDR
jgi:S-adenosylmethionine:tRNA ribosyltransferase-isomerase